MADRDPKAGALDPGLLSTSLAEVERVLQALQARREPLAVAGGAGATTQWRLREIDPARLYIVAEPLSGADSIAALLARPEVAFLADFGGMHIEFAAADPQRSADGEALRLRFPGVTVSRQRRTHPRAEVPEDFPLHCAIPAGAGVALEGQVMDLSQGGIGLLVRSTFLVPAPGTLIRGWRVERPKSGSVLVDLEVRHCRPVAFGDGSQAQRWGCQFLDPSEEAKELMVLFATE